MQMRQLRELMKEDMDSLRRELLRNSKGSKEDDADASGGIPERGRENDGARTEAEGAGDAKGATAHSLNGETARYFFYIERLANVTIRHDNEPRHLILTPESPRLSLTDAADMVDDFLARHSIYQVDSEPSGEGEPLMWMLGLVPSPELSVFRALDRLQYDKAAEDCGAVKHSTYWCSGWHADLWYSVRGTLNRALTEEEPVSMVFPEVCKDHDSTFVKSWHYAADACPAKDLSCFFLNHSSCPRPESFEKEKELFSLDREIPLRFRKYFDEHHALSHKKKVSLWDIHNDAGGEFYNFLVYSYATRMRYWLRQEVKRRVESFKLKEPCAVMHVRQNDIALHDNWRRFYYPLKAYLDVADDALKAMGIHTILLMTDTAEVIDEAKKHTEYEWRWMEKNRFRRSSTIKFEDQFPSGSPKEETIALLTLFHLASECRLFIGGVSGFGTLAYRYMCLLHTKNVWDCPPVRVLDQHKEYKGNHEKTDPRQNRTSGHFGKVAVTYD
mmetsp:Transcript_18235/g.44767  ORF Transcript_18235/g.44767 Transcript_18235/m.44767 type:complete len:500 (+) Transcript_18235:98-1597(+)